MFLVMSYFLPKWERWKFETKNGGSMTEKQDTHFCIRPPSQQLLMRLCGWQRGNSSKSSWWRSRDVSRDVSCDGSRVIILVCRILSLRPVKFQSWSQFKCAQLCFRSFPGQWERDERELETCADLSFCVFFYFFLLLAIFAAIWPHTRRMSCAWLRWADAIVSHHWRIDLFEWTAFAN